MNIWSGFLDYFFSLPDDWWGIAGRMVVLLLLVALATVLVTWVIYRIPSKPRTASSSSGSGSYYGGSHRQTADYEHGYEAGYEAGFEDDVYDGYDHSDEYDDGYNEGYYDGHYDGGSSGFWDD